MARRAGERARQGWDGLVWAEGIPGTLAGAAVGNAGAYGGDIAGTIERIEIVQPEGTLEAWTPEQMAYGYRDSILKGNDPTGAAILAVEFRLRRADPIRLRTELARIAAERKAKTPPGATCGSVFRNPAGESAGQLIDAAGCKGMRVGGAVVSEKHANYFLNEGGATATDLRRLIEAVRRRVRDQSGISLELEIQLVGFRSDG